MVSGEMSKKTDHQQLIQLKKEVGEWKERYIRALADYQNLEKRTKEQRSEEIRFAAKDLILKILPAIDILEEVDRVLNDQGVKLVFKQFKHILTIEQVERIKAVGEKFDPHTMECVEVVQSDKEDEVVGEVRAGYTMFGKVIRVAQVKVGKKG